MKRLGMTKVKVNPIYDTPYVGKVPVGEDTCPGPSAFRDRLVSFLATIILPDFPPFAAGRTVSERGTFSLKCVSSRGLRHSRQVL